MSSPRRWWGAVATAGAAFIAAVNGSASDYGAVAGQALVAAAVATCADPADQIRLLTKVAGYVVPGVAGLSGLSGPGGTCEQRHARAELQVVRIAEDRLDGAAFDAVHQLRTRAQPLTEERMRQVGARLSERFDGIALRHGARPKAAQLREDEPHPVALLVPGGELGAYLAEHRILCCDEAAEVGVIGGHGAPTLVRF